MYCTSISLGNAKKKKTKKTFCESIYTRPVSNQQKKKEEEDISFSSSGRAYPNPISTSILICTYVAARLIVVVPGSFEGNLFILLLFYV